MILDIFDFFLVLLLILIAAIFAVKYSKTDRTFEEATKICIRSINSFIKNIIREFLNNPELMKLNYPVFIGYNGYDIIPENVENSFKELYSHFEVIYYDFYNNTLPNRIIYRFKISNPKINMDYINFVELLEKIIERILVKHLRNCEVNIPCYNFVAVKIDGDILYVSIAKNNLGTIETENIRRKVKADYFDSRQKSESKEITTDWDESRRL